MEVKGTRGILDDNSIMYLIFLDSVIQHADPDAKIAVNKKDLTIDVIVYPSEGAFKQDLVSNIVFAHRLFGIKAVFSKSLAVQKNLFFQIDISS